MTVVYLLIVFSPLAPLAMQSNLNIHAHVGECSGDCRIDGCSPERSAAHTCCCWQSRKKTARAAFTGSAGDCCGTGSASAASKPAGHCPATVAHDDHDEDGAVSSAAGTTQDKNHPTSIGTLPCGSGKHIALWGAETVQHLPYHYSGEIPVRLEQSLPQQEPVCMVSRHNEPPDPPPRRSLFLT